MATQSSVLLQCFQQAATASRRALERCLDVAVAQLQEAEARTMKIAERDDLGVAWRELLKHKAAWCDQYPRDLLQAFKAAALTAAKEPAAASATRPAAAARVRLDALSLVDDTQLSEAIESSRLLQRMLPVVEQPLSELDALISSAQGLGTVTPELNPVRPEIFAQTLRSMIVGAAVEPATASLAMKHVGDTLGKELKEIYAGLLELLARAKVQAAGYRVLQTPASAAASPSGFGKLEEAAHGARGPGGGHGGGAGAAANGMGSADGAGPAGGCGSHGAGSGLAPEQYADLSGYEIGDQLFQDFLYRGGSDAQQPLAPNYYEAVDRELAQLQAAPDSAPLSLPMELPPNYRDTPAPDRPQRFVDVLSQLSSKVWGMYSRAKERALVRTQLKKDATEVGQVLGMEVVRKVVNQVAQDPRLLVPVREAIVALEPSLLRLAMVDPRFLSDEQHPGRRLIEGVAQRSFKYNDEFSPEFETFFQPVAESFNALNSQAVGDVQPFDQALTQLDAHWTQEDRQQEQQRETVLQTLRAAEERQAQADQIAYDLSLRSDLEGVPAVVLDFLFGPWSLVMANARLADQGRTLDPGGFGAVVSDLLWSVKLQQTLNEPARLISLIPKLLTKLRAGLKSLDHGPEHTETFFGELMKLHQPVLELRRLRSQRDAAESAPLPLEIPLPEVVPATPEQRVPKASDLPWLGQKEQHAAGFADAAPDEPDEAHEAAPERPAQPVGDADEAASAAPGEPADAEESRAAAALQDAGLTPEQVLLGLREGCWVDMYSQDRWLRAQLIWASTKGTLFMFQSHGGQPHSMTKRSCEKLIRQRHLRPVDTQQVVGQALEALAA